MQAVHAAAPAPLTPGGSPPGAGGAPSPPAAGGASPPPSAALTSSDALLSTLVASVSSVLPLVASLVSAPAADAPAAEVSPADAAAAASAAAVSASTPPVPIDARSPPAPPLEAADPPPMAISLGLYVGVDSRTRLAASAAAADELLPDADALPLSPSLPPPPPPVVTAHLSSLGPDYVAPFEPDAAEVYVGVSRDGGRSPRAGNAALTTAAAATASPPASSSSSHLLTPGVTAAVTSPLARPPPAGVYVGVAAARGFGGGSAPAFAPAPSGAAAGASSSARVAAAVSAASAVPGASRAPRSHADGAAERSSSATLATPSAACGPSTRAVSFEAAREAFLEGAAYVWEEALPPGARGRGEQPGGWGRKPGVESGVVLGEERYMVITAAQRFRGYSQEELRWHDTCGGAPALEARQFEAQQPADADADALVATHWFRRAGVEPPAFGQPAAAVACASAAASTAGGGDDDPSAAGVPSAPLLCAAEEAEALRAAAHGVSSGVARLADALAAAAAENAALRARLSERRFAAADVSARLAAAGAEAERAAARAAALESDLATARDAHAALTAQLRRLEGAVAAGASEADMALQEAELQSNLERLREAVREERLRRSLRSAVQKEFICPITMTVFTDPVIAADGHSYERQAIEEWLAHHATSPLTNLKLPHKHLVPNRAIKSAVQSILAAGGGGGAEGDGLGLRADSVDRGPSSPAAAAAAVAATP
jgi:hypothetical protein